MKTTSSEPKTKAAPAAKRIVDDLSPPTVTVPAAARTLAVFETFARERRELSKSELARLLDLPESSCSDLLNSLLAIGYVARTATSRRYYPTGRLMSAASAIAQNDPLGAFSTEAATLLAERSGETSAVGVIDDGAAKVLALNEGTHRLRYVVAAGHRASLHATSLGKALLGMLDEAEVARLLRLRPLKSFSPATKTNPRDIEDELAMSRERGWYTANEEGGDGISSLAVSADFGFGPLALSLIGPTDRVAANHDRYLAALQEVKAFCLSGGDNPRGR
ncbi:IclR family transcriptional regulator [Niveispirillum sp. KHB5.9]|uniref:IclR family transcriptional regulator n=1 Tax=Niveispirillum sp. KHB5.9 TaxID=3400269 RepID=UPI003A86FE8E